MSAIFAQLANKFKEEEEQPNPIPIGIPTDTAVQTETFAEQPPTEQVTSQISSPAADSAKIYDHQENEAELEEEVEPGEEGNSRKEEGDGEGSFEANEPEEETVQEPVEGQSEEKELEVVDVEEGGSDEDRETLNERASRRSFRTQRRLETEETMSLREEAAILAAAKREAAERKRKGKQIATPSKSRKPRQASLSVVIQEPVTDRTKEPHYQEEESEGEGEENEGVYEKLEVELDQKLLEAMVYFKDPKLRKNCAGRVSETRKAKSGRKIHYPSLRGIGAEGKFLKYIRVIGFEWLLEHTPCEVPVNLAKEYFTSFNFEYTTDFDTVSIF